MKMSTMIRNFLVDLAIYFKLVMNFWCNPNTLIFIEGTNIVKIPVYHRNRMSYIFLECNKHNFQYEEFKHITAPNTPLILGVAIPGIKQQFNPSLFNVDEIHTIGLSSYDEQIYKNNEKIIIE